MRLVLKAMAIGVTFWACNVATPVFATNFQLKCAEEFAPITRTLPTSLNVPRLCACQEQRLREMGYDPGAWHDQIKTGITEIVKDPNSEQSKNYKAAYMKRVTDRQTAMQQCLTPAPAIGAVRNAK